MAQQQLNNLYNAVPGLDLTAENRAQAAARLQLRQQASQVAQQAKTQGLSGVRQAQALAPAAVQQQAQVAGQQLQQQQQQLGAQTQLGLQQADLQSRIRMTQAATAQQEQLADQARVQYEKLAEAQQATRRRITAEDIRTEKALRQQGLIYDTSMFFVSDQQQRDLSQLDERLTKEVFDARLTFAGSERQREFSNQLQLLDFAASSAKSQQELQQYTQIMQQEMQRQEVLFKVATQEMSDILRRGYIKEKGDLDFEAQRQIAEHIARVKERQAERQARDQRTATIIGTAISVAAVVAVAACLPGDTEIETPNGGVDIRLLKPGMLVMTRDNKGRKFKARIIRTNKMPTLSTHELIKITLKDGRSVAGSPRHPDATGRMFQDLSLGDSLDGSEIVSLSRLSYGNSYTYDILVDSPGSTYWADGIEIGSTLK